MVTLQLFPLGLLAIGATLQQPQPQPQIHWQRSLQDVRALQRASGRPILVAVNMDGESASERIVREQYRDPAFVAATRAFVCAVASAFRHTPRDFDDAGLRIPCPRLGEVTCGEHVALEPALFDAFLGGERIAPRHALVEPDGEVAFDLFQLWDLAELERALAAAAGPAGPPLDLGAPRPAAGWPERALARTQAGRADLERALAGVQDAGELEGALGELAAHGDAGSLPALQVALLRAAVLDGVELLPPALEAARALELEPQLSALLRARLFDPGPRPAEAGLGQDAWLLVALGRLDPLAPRTRTLLLSYLALGGQRTVPGAPSEREAARGGLLAALDAQTLRELAELLEKLEARLAAVDPPALLERARRAEPPPAATAPPEPFVEQDLAGALERAAEAAASSPADPQLQAAFGRAALALARRRVERGEGEVEPLLEDARAALERASRAQPGEVALLLERARVAYMQADHALQEQLALEALGALERGAAAEGDPVDLRQEALRWLGDAAARLVPVRSGGDLELEAAGMLRAGAALAQAALGPESDATDWLSLASLFGALGRGREQAAFALEGARRFPESQELHALLLRTLASAARVDEALGAERELARMHPRSSVAAWYHGWAGVQRAEWARRGERPADALDAYREAEIAFARSEELEPGFADTAQHYRALAALGRGFAHLLRDERRAAAEALVEALALRPQIAAVRDGLEREAVDLVDAALEWRASGASEVDSAAWLDALEGADPGNSFWARAVSDAELREALRADGRGVAAEGDRYLQRSLAAGRRAVALSAGEPERRALAQAATVAAERLLERSEPEGARPLLAEAASLLDQAEPPPQAALEELAAVAERLRAVLGPARPIARPGR